VSHYELFKPFDIDDGQLDGLSLQQAFVLGYELAEIDALLKLADGFIKPVHAENRERIEKWCKESGREFRLVWAKEDASESWMTLSVAVIDPRVPL
jgi:hypothetical protein